MKEIMGKRDYLEVIQEDIRRALTKPPKDRRWVMVIDLRRCTRCMACTVGCMAENKLPPGVIYRPVFEEESGIYPQVKRRFTPRLCMQCDAPPCVEACPNKGKATLKSTEGVSAGVVAINYEQCIGCGRCAPACPYQARTLDGGGFYTEGTPKVEEYEKGPSFEYSRKWVRQKNHLPVGNARKCHFCSHRLKDGMIPMCVNTCPCRANYFGDANDPQSLVAQMLKVHKTAQMKEVKESVAGFPLKVKDKKPVKSQEWKDATDKSIKGYPGKTPLFGPPWTKPRVYYIL